MKWWRLRPILACCSLNDYLEPPPFVMDSLEKCAHIIEPDDCLLLIDLVSGFTHGLMHPEAREFLGMTFAGREFLSRASPMGARPIPWFFTKLGWQMAKVFRKAGIRCIFFVDDWTFFCKEDEVVPLSNFLIWEFGRRGWLINFEKSLLGKIARRGVSLGVEIRLDEFRFCVPAGKKKKIMAGIEDLLRCYEAGEPVRARLLAKTLGRINALAVAVGRVVRQMTRGMYHWLAVLTGVDPDAPRRYIKVAWNRRAEIGPRQALELRFWASELPDHPGRPIRDVGARSVMRLDRCGSQRLAVFASDAGDPAWMATLDEGLGSKMVARQAFTAWESAQSSGLRELWSVLRGLLSFETFKDATLVVLNDNQTAVQALEIGSKTPAMNDVAVAIFLVAMRRNIQIVSRWLGRASAEVQENDDGSKLVDRSDFMLDPAVFRASRRTT